MNHIFPEKTRLLQMIDRIIDPEQTRDQILLSVSGLLKNAVSHYDWVGFYIVDLSGEYLILGPYTGAPTDHKKIAFGKGVCGQVAASETNLIIQNIEQEKNYLSCSSKVKSEAVFPIIKAGQFVAELDIDSHSLEPFTNRDTELLEAVCQKLEQLF